MSDWQTDISTFRSGDGHIIRGYAFDDLIRSRSFVDIVFLLLRGDLPSKNESELLESVLVAMCEHGPDSPSTAATCVSVTTGNPMNAALAAGLLTVGPRHGGAVASAMEIIAQDRSALDVVKEAMDQGRRLSGFGHKIYKEEDPRTKVLFEKANALGLAGTFVHRARAIEFALREAKGRTLPINIDGAAAALLLELKMPVAAGNAMFMLGRLPGLIAHAIQAQTEKTYRRS